MPGFGATPDPAGHDAPQPVVHQHAGYVVAGFVAAGSPAERANSSSVRVSMVRCGILDVSDQHRDGAFRVTVTSGGGDGVVLGDGLLDIAAQARGGTTIGPHLGHQAAVDVDQHAVVRSLDQCRVEGCVRLEEGVDVAGWRHVPPSVRCTRPGVPAPPR